MLRAIARSTNLCAQGVARRKYALAGVVPHCPNSLTWRRLRSSSSGSTPSQKANSHRPGPLEPVLLFAESESVPPPFHDYSDLLLDLIDIDGPGALDPAAGMIAGRAVVAADN